MDRIGGWVRIEWDNVLGRLKKSSGQDLIEYALLAGFVAVAGGALIPWGASGPISAIFSKLSELMTSLGGV
jgi:Flp pilus assembly pilin Flp